MPASPASAAESDPVRLGWMVGSPPPADKRVAYPDGSLFQFPKTRWSYGHFRQLVPSVNIARGTGAVAALRPALRDDIDALTFTPLGQRRRMTWAQSLEANYTDAIVVLHRGRIAYERYLGVMSPTQTHMAMSVTKSFTGVLAAMLEHEGLLDPEAPVAQLIPELAGGAYRSATVRDVMDMRVGVRYSENYADKQAEVWQYLSAARIFPQPVGYRGPEGLYAFLQTLEPEGPHGEGFTYKTVNTDVLGWLIHRASGRNVAELLAERIWSRLGAEHDAYMLVDGTGTPFAGGGFNPTLRDMARFGEMMRREGRYNGRQIVPAAVVADIRRGGSKAAFVGAFDNAAKADDGIPAGVERVGLLGHSCRVDTTLDAVIAGNPPYKASPVPDPESVFTMVYTSGTTGNPKGVMHMHATPGRVVPELMNSLKQKPGDCTLFSFLPMAHIAERILIEMGAMYMGGTISFSESLATFGEELRSVQPTFFFAVPRLWIEFKEGVDAKVPPAAQKNLTEEQRAGIRKMLGVANARFILTGSAPCPKDVQQWFIDMGIWLRDGYGMTENCIHGCAWVADGAPVAGCVGKGIGPSVKVRLGEGNEVLFSSMALMKGYYKEPEKTAEVLVDGWYHTGDTGRLDEDGNLWLTGRLSEVFKTSKGKFIKPGSLEDRFGACNLLGQFCIFGHGLDQPVALVSLSENSRKLDREEVATQLAAFLDKLNADLPPYERMPQMFVTLNEWTTAAGLLTPTLKLKRKSVESQYRPWVEANLGKGAVVFE